MIEQHKDEICYLQFAHLTQFPEIAHGAFTRLGGYSTAATWGLNASFMDENPEHVLHNRLRALQALGVRAKSMRDRLADTQRRCRHA